MHIYQCGDKVKVKQHNMTPPNEHKSFPELDSHLRKINEMLELELKVEIVRKLHVMQEK